jgi:hypothetical protein
MRTSNGEFSYFGAIAEGKARMHQTPDRGGYPWILVGMGYLSFDHIAGKLGEMEYGVPYSKLYEQPIKFLTSRKDKWESVIKQKSSLYDYLNTNIYRE